MSEQQLIDGYIDLYKSLYSFSMVCNKLKNAFHVGGMSMQTLGVAYFNAWFRFDAWRKEKAFART